MTDKNLAKAIEFSEENFIDSDSYWGFRNYYDACTYTSDRVFSGTRRVTEERVKQIQERFSKES